jgi:hypothetical protein
MNVPSIVWSRLLLRGLHAGVSCRKENRVEERAVTDHLLNTLYLCTEEVIISKAMIYH